MQATLVHEDHIAWTSTQTNIYALDKPYKGFDHIAVSIHGPIGPYDAVVNGAEVVGCNETGGIEADTVEAIYKTPDSVSFAGVLTRIGYTVEDY